MVITLEQLIINTVCVLVLSIEGSVEVAMYGVLIFFTVNNFSANFLPHNLQHITMYIVATNFVNQSSNNEYIFKFE